METKFDPKAKVKQALGAVTGGAIGGKAGKKIEEKVKSTLKNKKYAIQNFNDNANITLDAVQQGLDLKQSDLNILNRQYKKIIELGGSTEAADKKLNKIKMFHKSNESLKKKGKDPFVENQQFDT